MSETSPPSSPEAEGVGAREATPGVPPAVRERLLRERLRVLLLGRLLVVTVFLAGVVALRVFSGGFDTPVEGPATLYGTLLALAISLGSLALAPRVAALVPFAVAQVVLDVLFVTAAIAAVWRGVPGAAAVLYAIPIANAAGLLLWRGAMATAVASSVAYVALLAHALERDGGGGWLADVALPGAAVTAFLGAAALTIGALARRVACAEETLAQREAEVERLASVERALSRDLECGVLITDVAGHVRSANPAAQKILGLPAAAALGRAIDWLIPTLATAEPVGDEAGLLECELRSGDTSARRLRVKRTPIADTYGKRAGELVLLQDMARPLELGEPLARGDEVGLLLARGDEPAPGATQEEPRGGMIGTCPAMRVVARLIDKVARSDATVLVAGESGTGKELVARAIHDRSGRAAGPFVVVNCGAIPENLIESELFGHAKGSFTGAIADRPGLFRRAHGGTIFLDEIGELPIHLQVRLLRVLQDHLVMPVGGAGPIPVDVRVVAATNRVLEELVKEGRFREDLYYRLAVIVIALPPLRERGDDLAPLIEHFVRQAAARHARAVSGVSVRAMQRLLRYPYPGNVRELENIVEHATTLCEGGLIREMDLPEAAREGARSRLGAAHAASAALTAARREEPSAAVSGGSGSGEETGTGAQGIAGPVGSAPDGVEAGPSRPVLLPIDEGEGASLDEQLARREKAMLLAALERAAGVKKRAATLLGINYRSFRHRLQKYGLDGHDSDPVLPEDSPPVQRERGF